MVSVNLVIIVSLRAVPGQFFLLFLGEGKRTGTFQLETVISEKKKFLMTFTVTEHAFLRG